MKISGKPRRQRGIALLMILAVAGILAVVLVGNALIRKHTEQERLAVTQAALAQAKEALIAYAVARMEESAKPTTGAADAPDVPGHLPCPSTMPPPTPAEGASNGSCGGKNVTVVGRLPWATLKTGPLRDGYGECLWYVVSGRVKNNPPTSRGDMVNWDLSGQIRLNSSSGTRIADEVVAAVIAPGRALGQDRSSSPGMSNCPGNFNASNYLEARTGIGNNHTPSAVASGVTTLANGSANDPVLNDQVIHITAQELLAISRKRPDFDFSRDSEANRGALRTLTRTVATCLANYAQNSRKAVDPLATDNGDRRMPWAGMRVQIGNTALDSTEQDVFDETGLLAGRVPTASLAFAIFGNPRFLEVCPSFGPVRNWWNHWRDHLYYAVSVDFSPFDPFEESNLLTATMCRGHCLSATDDDPDSYKYAAIVIFAGEKIGAQQRRLAYDVVTNTNALADRHDFANYLEGKNRVNFAQVPPLTYLNPPTALQRVYGRATTPPNEYNDIMYCIRVPTAFATPSIEPC